MHEFDGEIQATQRRAVTPGEPTDASQIAGYSPTRAPI